MKTAYYTFTVQEDEAMASGFGAARRTSIVRSPAPAPRRGNVVDLNAWRARQDELLAQNEAPWEPDEEPAPAHEAGRPALGFRFYTELASTLGVLAVLAALAARILLF